MLLLWRGILVLILLPLLKGDYTSHHLTHNLDHSVSPCSDFHSHVCGAHMTPDKTVKRLSELHYSSWAAKMNSRSKSNPVMNDIDIARRSGTCQFDITAYTRNLHQRCGTLVNCYHEEFSYFYNIYKKSVKKVGYGFAYFARYSNRLPNIPRLLNVTARLVKELVRRVGEYNFDKIVSSFERLHDRLAIIHAVERTNRMNLPRLRKIRELQRNIKNKIVNRFKATQWLNETDSFGVDLLSQFLIILDEMKVSIDFDEKDLDLSTWRNINRIITSKYFEHSKRSTGCARFDVIHPFLTMGNERTIEMDFPTSIRMSKGMRHNAFYESESNYVTLLAPFVYPYLTDNSSDTTMFAFAAGLAHEIFHPFVKTEFAHNSATFFREFACLTYYYIKACETWGEGVDVCESGYQTFSEDGPDVEGLRVAYELMSEAYSEEQLQAVEYEELGITREQAFFYAYGIRRCSRYPVPFNDKHSNGTIRLNVMVSMMPEFTKAFGCQKEDAEYSDEKSVCYLFGPRCGFDRNAPEEEQEVETFDDGNEDGNTVTDDEKDEIVDTELNGSGNGAETGSAEGSSAIRNDDKNVENTDENADERVVDGSGEEQIEEELLS